MWYNESVVYFVALPIELVFDVRSRYLFPAHHIPSVTLVLPHVKTYHKTDTNA